MKIRELIIGPYLIDSYLSFDIDAYNIGCDKAFKN